MPERLPGMPLGAGDLFVCRIDDSGPPPVQRAAPAPLYDVWLVLALCSSCNARTGRYCRAHDTRGTSR